jgi:hypothetical protein
MIPNSITYISNKMKKEEAWMRREEVIEVFKLYSDERNRQYISTNLTEGMEGLSERIEQLELKRWNRIQDGLKDRGIEVMHSDSKVKVIDIVEDSPFLKLYYHVLISWRLKQGAGEYDSSWEEKRMCLLKEEQGWWIVKDQLIEKEGVGLLNQPMPLDAEYEIRNPNERRAKYNREKAVEYAERWWNDYNPKFREFDVDCTNYISQCLLAGGAPMKYSSNRSKGWWYRFEDPAQWSYSWAVAHSLRWYLPTSQSGLRAKEVSSADQLQLGDVICYDFDGDGRWQHNTIVVAKDTKGMPLVNAHTTNSRKRYWDYRDSYAWTDKTAYKFFRIQDDF